MTNAQKSEVITSLCNLLRETTQKRMVVDTEYRCPEERLKIMKESAVFSDGIRVEYYNTIFTQQEVEVLKRKLLKLVEQL